MAKKTASQKAAEKEAAEQAAANGAIPAAEGAASAPAAEEKKDEPKAPGKIEQILNHFKAGKTNKEIASLPVLDAQGNPVMVKNDKNEDVVETFHPTTISIQINKFKKANPDLYPPQPKAKTKKQLAAEAKAAKEAQGAEAGAAAETTPA